MKFNRTKIAEFQNQDCALTLREALAEFYSVNSHIFSAPKPDTEWTLFGTDLSFTDYVAYAKSPEGKKLISDIGFINIVKSIFLGIPLLYKVYLRYRKMNRKWKVRGYHEYMDTPLVEIRKKFNLCVLKY